MKSGNEINPWEIEDYLQTFIASNGARVFHKMNDEKTSAHSDSYGTLLSFVAFDEAFKASNYNANQWLLACDYWLRNDCPGIPLKIIANILKRTLTTSTN